jgi:peptide/nickel transport system substrate-binding protein
VAPSLTLGAAIDISSWDPGENTSGHQMEYLQPVYDTLLRFDTKAAIVPMLATAWKYSADNKELTLTLRKGVTFSDGTPFDAEAAKTNLEHLKKASVTTTNLASVDQIEAVDPVTVKLTLSQPDPGLLYNLTQPAGMMASPKGLSAGNLKTTPVGSGPYVLQKAGTTSGSTYTLARNPRYWDKTFQPYDKIVLKVITDATARLNALASGQIDGGFGTAQLAGQAKSRGLTVTKEPGDWQGLLIVDRDGKKIPALKDVRVRQAINYAIDAAGLLKKLRLGNGTRTPQIFNPAAKAYDPALNSTYPYDPAKAKQLMADAGYAKGFTVKTIEIPGYNDYQPLMIQQLAAIGIKIKPQVVQPSDAITAVLSGKFPMFWFSIGSTPNAWTDITNFVDAKGVWNMYHSTDAQLTQLMDKIKSTTGAEQDAAYKSLSKRLVDLGWFSVWYVQDNFYMTNSKTTAVPRPGNVVPFIYNFRPAKT